MIRPGLLAASRPASGGGSSYHADAIQTDGTQSLLNDSLVSTDNGYWGLAFWFKRGEIPGIEELYVSDPQGNYTNSFEFTNSPAFVFHLLTESGDKEYTTVANDVSAFLDNNEWHFFIAAAKTNESAGQKIVKIKVDGVTVVPNSTIDEDSSFNAVFNGLPLSVLDDGYIEGYVGELADFRLAPGQNWLTLGEISDDTVALFRDAVTGKPRASSIATASLGTPAVLFSGNADTFGDNQGNGGDFVLTGVLANASTSPSD